MDLAELIRCYEQSIVGVRDLATACHAMGFIHMADESRAMLCTLVARQKAMESILAKRVAKPVYHDA